VVVGTGSECSAVEGPVELVGWASRLCTLRGGEGVVGHVRLAFVASECVSLVEVERGERVPGVVPPVGRTVNLVMRVEEVSESDRSRERAGNGGKYLSILSKLSLLPTTNPFAAAFCLEGRVEGEPVWSR